MSRWVKPRSAPYEPDEVADAEAVVAYYEQKLEEAYERLGELVEAREQRAKQLAAVGRGRSCQG